MSTLSPSSRQHRHFHNTKLLCTGELSLCQPLVWWGLSLVSNEQGFAYWPTPVTAMTDTLLYPDELLLFSTDSYSFIHLLYSTYFCRDLDLAAVQQCYIITHIRSQPHCLQGNLINWPSATFLFIYCFAVFTKGSQGAFSQKKRPNCKRTFSGLTWSLECEYARDMTDPQPGLTNPSLRLTTTSWVWHSAMLTSWQDTKNQKPFNVMLLAMGLGQSQY